MKECFIATALSDFLYKIGIFLVKKVALFKFFSMEYRLFVTVFNTKELILKD